MSQLQYNITQLSQIADIDFTGAAPGDVMTIKTVSPLEFEFGPNGGGTGTVDGVTANDPVSVDNTDPANPVINIAIADKAQAGVVFDQAQEWWGVKTFDSLPVSFVDPVDPEQLTTKKYVDTFAAGLQVKAAVRAATLVPGTLASSFENGDIIDGVTLATGDRILIKNQTNAVENGIYTVNASGAPTRATDYDQAGEANVGTFTTVTEGGQKNTQWVQINTGTPDPGTDALNFSRLNISGNVNTIQSPARGTLTGAVTLNSSDLYYTGASGSTLKTVVDLKVTTNTTQVITGNKTFQGTQNFTGTVTAPNQLATDNSTRVANTAFVQNALASAGNLITVSIPLTAAQIKNAFSSPVPVIASPGAGKVIDIIDCVFKLNYAAPAYATAQSYILYNPAVNSPLVTIPTGIINSTANIVYKRVPESVELAVGGVVFTNTLADLVSGNSTGNLYITYRVITL